ncbi:autophagy protein Apg9 [Colletotrichum truncatum]|uniref:Autophagy protein Apg9 n=1 Tax=Colletotrichum truncatum TaxID=5467 RepID=A0ACC3YXI9_COLTU|nr:autophagy protein Apg9 [Colletotrichum truncatum]KAF6791011.1 autophagy protein Apg9 [Colletotrichum truncatum]
MTSNIFSRLGQPTRGSRSSYEALRGGRDSDPDIEEQAGLDVDEENLKEHFQDYDLDQVRGIAADDSHATLESNPNLFKSPREASGQGSQRTRARRDPGARWHRQEDDADNDVPASLLVEPHDVEGDVKAATRKKQLLYPARPAAIPGPSTRRTFAQWETTQAQQRLHPADSIKPIRPHTKRLSRGLVANNEKEKALWRWVNISNLDFFIQDVYYYYRGSGFWCIVCARALHLLESAFFAVFLTFMTQCVDYSLISDKNKKSLGEVVIPQCTRKMSFIWNMGLWLYVFYFIWKAVQFTVDLRRLYSMRNFYTHLLEIPEEDMQTVSWQDIVGQVMSLRDANPKTAINITPSQRKWLRNQSKERLDAHDIANRLMRRENYLIAMMNKDVVDLTLPIPFMRKHLFFSRSLEWNLHFSILSFVFDENNQVNQEFLKADRRGQLSAMLKTRLMFAGIINLLIGPFVVAYLILVHALTYYNEYQKDPSTFSHRRYTPLAEWKFREFNELPHLFQERLNMSYPFASLYIDQFPKKLTEQFARSVTFIAGAVTSVLAVASFLEPEHFLGFDLLFGKSALFYIGIFAATWAAARGMISEETTVFNPEYALRSVIDYIRYMPDHWQGRLHTAEVKREFSELYKLKILILVEEIVGILTASLVLIFSAPKCSDQIIDFFREFTIHVDGVGYVCSFAVFDFKKGAGKAKQQAANGDVREDYYTTKHGKMAASYYGFLDNYVVNPRTGMPGHLPPGSRHTFHPPPAFPGLNSPALAADMLSSRAGRHDLARSRAFGGGFGQQTRTPRFGPSMTAPSPMASMLLDPHHQPPATGFGVRSTHRSRGGRSGHQGEGIIEESTEDGLRTAERLGSQGLFEDEVFEGSGPLGESVWETSPPKGLSRESSATEDTGGQDAGVLGLIYQFQQAHRNNRQGGGVL